MNVFFHEAGCGVFLTGFHMMIRRSILALCWLFLAGQVVAETAPVVDTAGDKATEKPALLTNERAGFDALFGTMMGTFVLYDDIEGITLVHDPARAQQRFSPWSTFELPAILILLDSGVLPSVDQKVPWDKERYPVHDSLPDYLKVEWGQDHSLQSAYHSYAVWLFLDQMDKVSCDMIKNYLTNFSYGEWGGGDCSTGFWLGKELKISAAEQVKFLRALIGRQFALKSEVISAVLPMMLVQKGENYQLAFKTGSGATDDQAFGWAIGYVIKEGRYYFFAMNLSASSYQELSDRRQEIMMGALERLGLIRQEKVQ